MKYIIVFILAFSFSSWAQVFLPGTEDIPLMKGLKNVEETASFDNPSERMVLISAETTLSEKAVFEFYHQSLSNLGWQEIRPHYFERGADLLSIEISQGKPNQVQFKLSQVNP